VDVLAHHDRGKGPLAIGAPPVEQPQQELESTLELCLIQLAHAVGKKGPKFDAAMATLMDKSKDPDMRRQLSLEEAGISAEA
jgi:hypothetical protein